MEGFMKNNNLIKKYSLFLTMAFCLFYFLGASNMGTSFAAALDTEGTVTPTVSAVPELTQSPEVSTSPEISQTPEDSDILEVSTVPTVSTIPEGSLTPEPTDIVSPTAAPTPAIYSMTFYDTDGSSLGISPIYRQKGAKWGTLPAPVKNGYTFAGWKSASGKSYSLNCGRKVTQDVEVYAHWKVTTYTITYHLNKGAFSSGTITSEYTINSPLITLPEPTRKKFLFKGWYSNGSFTGKNYNSISTGSYGNVDFYAKWQSAAPAPVNNVTLSNSSNKLKVKLKKVSGAKGYEVKISTSKTFAKNVATYELGTKTSFTLTAPAKKTYYVKARAFAYDSTGSKTYSAYGTVAKIKVTKTTKEYAATSTSAKITSAKALSSESIQIKATIKKRIKSSDDYYYLVKLNPSKNTVEKTVKKFLKSKYIDITLPIDIAGKNEGNLFVKYGIAIKQNGKYKLISKPSYITNPEKSAYNTMKYIQPATKKGIQGATITDLGSKHTLLNLDLKDVISTNGTGTPYVYNGKTYYFNAPLSWQVSYYNSQGISVSMVVLLSWDENLKYLIHPAARTPGKNYYTLNTEEKVARETLEAAFSYLGIIFGQKNCYVSNWILGNEVNAHAAWNYAGNLSLSNYSKSYAQAFQMLYYGVKHGYKSARVFISLDHEWNKASNGFSSKAFLTAFASAIEAENPNVNWNIAFHAYPAPLTSPSFWNNKNVSNTITTPYITPLNIEVLTSYVKKTYGKNTRIILSEQGFTSTSGEHIQAAALAYAYYKCEFNSMIDAFIIRCEYDADVEVRQGLSMGLIQTSTGRAKEAYNVYKYMDTPQSTTYTKKYLATIGAKNWNSIVPNYKSSKFKSMPKAQ